MKLFVLVIVLLGIAVALLSVKMLFGKEKRALSGTRCGHHRH